MTTWTEDVYNGVISGATLHIANHIVFIHRHRDFEPHQWVYTCLELAIAARPIGKRGDTLDTAKTRVVRALLARLSPLVRGLEEISKKPE